MCRATNVKKSQMVGCPLLLQFWSWERMRIGDPHPFNQEAPDLDDDIDPHLRPCWPYLKWAGPKHFAEVPHGCRNEHHGVERKKRGDWRIHMQQYVQIWASRLDRLVFGHPVPDGDDIDLPTDEYVAWSSKITRRLVQPRLVDDETHAYHPSTHEWPSHVGTLVHCARKATEGFTSDVDDDENLDDDHVTHLNSDIGDYHCPTTSQA
ncbi:hypothetical protein QQ045_031596 [Rhodiola kirilowii]